VTAPAPAAVPTGNTYDRYGTSNPLERRMMQGFMSALDAMLDGFAPRRILEIGVGEGHVTARVRERLPAAAIVGVDLPDDELAGQWRAADLACVFGDATRLPSRGGAFDLVLAIEVLEHIPAPDAALAELARVCSGALIASVPFEPIWRAGNLARGRYVRDPRQHARTRQPLDPLGVHPLREKVLRGGAGAQPAALDHDPSPSEGWMRSCGASNSSMLITPHRALPSRRVSRLQYRGRGSPPRSR
jgi:SAM-dependent methyltransferase